MSVDTFYTPPSNVTVTVELRGAGGTGFIGDYTGRGGGGGGGAGYSVLKNFPLTGGVSYLVRRGQPFAGSGEDSLFTSIPDCLAKGGQNGYFDNGGLGGPASGGIGTIKKSGGNGNEPAHPADNPGGGGGGAGGRSGDGVNGSTGTGGQDGDGNLSGGAGGAPGGADQGSPGAAGVDSGGGGGGGGACGQPPGAVPGGLGAEGVVMIWDSSDWNDSTEKPNPGAVPLYVSGVPIPSPPAATVRSYAFFM